MPTVAQRGGRRPESIEREATAATEGTREDVFGVPPPQFAAEPLAAEYAARLGRGPPWPVSEPVQRPSVERRGFSVEPTVDPYAVRTLQASSSERVLGSAWEGHPPAVMPPVVDIPGPLKAPVGLRTPPPLDPFVPTPPSWSRPLIPVPPAPFGRPPPRQFAGGGAASPPPPQWRGGGVGGSSGHVGGGQSPWSRSDGGGGGLDKNSAAEVPPWGTPRTGFCGAAWPPPGPFVRECSPGPLPPMQSPQASSRSRSPQRFAEPQEARLAPSPFSPHHGGGGPPFWQGTHVGLKDTWSNDVPFAAGAVDRRHQASSPRGPAAAKDTWSNDVPYAPSVGDWRHQAGSPRGAWSQERGPDLWGGPASRLRVEPLTREPSLELPQPAQPAAALEVQNQGAADLVRRYLAPVSEVPCASPPGGSSRSPAGPAYRSPRVASPVGLHAEPSTVPRSQRHGPKVDARSLSPSPRLHPPAADSERSARSPVAFPQVGAPPPLPFPGSVAGSPAVVRSGNLHEDILRATQKSLTPVNGPMGRVSSRQSLQSVVREPAVVSEEVSPPRSRCSPSPRVLVDNGSAACVAPARRLVGSRSDTYLAPYAPAPLSVAAVSPVGWTNYQAMSIQDLKLELRKRGLDSLFCFTEDDLISRLREHDRASSSPLGLS